MNDRSRPLPPQGSRPEEEIRQILTKPSPLGRGFQALIYFSNPN
eukprot:COSAG01_NODE_66628_length_269_cov_1.029412_1_plen_43_part_10